MKIGIDIRALQWEHRYRGIGVYLKCLLEALSKIDHSNHYLFYCWDKPNPLDDVEIEEGFHYELKVIGPKPVKLLKDRLRNRRRRQIQLKKGEVDVFFQPDAGYGLARGTQPQVAVVYDLIQLLFREQHFPKSVLKLIRRNGLKHTVGNKLSWSLYKWSLSELATAKGVISISGTTKHDLLEYNPAIESAKIVVTHLAASDYYQPSQHYQQTLSKHAITKPFLLYVGAADYRKNIIGLVKAFNQLKPRHDIQLVLAGKAFEAAELAHTPKLRSAIATSPFQSDIKLLGYVPRKIIRDLYTAAKIFVFPSIYEGFGLPILEAMACECAVVAYKVASVSEISGDAAVLLPPGSKLSEPLSRLLNDEGLREKMVARGRVQTNKFSWIKTAGRTLEVLEKVGRE
jgi:glycosyltransferase involved in cell wall biosynthesis